MGKKVRGVGRLPEGQRRTGKGKRKSFALEGPRPSGGGGRGRPFLSLPATAQLGLRPGAAAAEAAMGVEGCTKCIKYLLFVFNFIFWVSPSAAGAVGLHVLLEPGFFHSFPPPPPTNQPPCCALHPAIRVLVGGERLSFAIFFFFMRGKRSFIYLCIYSRGTSIYTRVDGYIFTYADPRHKGGGSARLCSARCPLPARLIAPGFFGCRGLDGLSRPPCGGDA